MIRTNTLCNIEKRSFLQNGSIGRNDKIHSSNERNNGKANLRGKLFWLICAVCFGDGSIDRMNKYRRGRVKTGSGGEADRIKDFIENGRDRKMGAPSIVEGRMSLFVQSYDGALDACRGLIGGTTPGLLSGLSG